MVCGVNVQAPSVSITSTSDTDEFGRIEFPQDNSNQKVLLSVLCELQVLVFMW